MVSNDALAQLWGQESNIVRAYYDRQSLYYKLAEEVAYILKKAVIAINVQYSSVSYRVKLLDSFCEKAVRKNYKNPLTEIKDLAGVRIVYLYLSDREAIEAMIEQNFSIMEREDKISESNPQEFGYGAVHYLVKLGSGSIGARYDDLKDLLCEIQVRTILQDAWAIVAHHLSYKHESAVPSSLRRKLNALAGLFETADDQFNQLNIDRVKYKNEVAGEIESDTKHIFQEQINLDSLMVYTNWKLPDRERITQEGAAELLQELTKAGYTTISQLDNAIDRSLEAIIRYERDDPPFDSETGKRTLYAQSGVIRNAVQFLDESQREGRIGKHKMEKYLPLIKPKKGANK